jgi:hypothetical protein
MFIRLTLLAAAVLLLAACEAKNLSRPEEILDRIELDFPSILGYARVSMDAMSRLDKETGSIPLDPRLFTPFSNDISKLCKPGGYLRIAWIDPQIFGGSVALHFDSGEESLVAFLEKDPRFERLPGSEPPEFMLKEKFDPIDQVLYMARMAGVEAPLEGLKPFDRIIVDETPSGTFVLPSHDVRGDFVRFLEDTDYLAPWGDASLVVNIEVIRFARAHAEMIRQWRSVFAEVMARAEGHLEGGLLVEIGKSLPQVLLDWTKAFEGLRFTSKHPVSGKRELAIQAVEGSFLAEGFASMREDVPDLAGLVPEGLALQANFDPGRLAPLLKRAVDYYHDVVVEAATATDTVSYLRGMAHDEGRYLAGVSLTLDGPHLVFMNALDGEAAGDTFLDLIFSGHSFETVGKEIERCDLETMKFLPELAFERGAAPDLRVTTIQYKGGAEPGALTRKYLRLAGMGAGPLRGMTVKGACYIKFSLPPLPGIEKLLPRAIMGYGLVEGDRLTIRFLD